MAIVYNKLFKLFEEKGITTYKIRKENIVSQGTLTKMKNNSGSVDTRTIDKICKVLNCQPGDILEYVPDNEEK